MKEEVVVDLKADFSRAAQKSVWWVDDWSWRLYVDDICWQCGPGLCWRNVFKHLEIRDTYQRYYPAFSLSAPRKPPLNSRYHAIPGRHDVECRSHAYESCKVVKPDFMTAESNRHIF